MSDAFLVRRATRVDIPVIARQRAEMFADMGVLPPEQYDALVAESRRHLEAALPSGEYLAWLVAPREAPDQIVAGAGVLRRRVPPHPLRTAEGARVARGDQAIVLNVFTERAWRRRGLARLLMEHVLRWAGDAGIETLVLHASDDGRPLYQALGFVPTNEMRFQGTLPKGGPG
ncbi:MAG TPA: GNAT family N-acetyltransferase [Candidatus Saccharimonadales bacterium]|nr:GNAT family N-acetyltransferase [Candidatus Saccharimonadales bacterium]